MREGERVPAGWKSRSFATVSHLLYSLSFSFHLFKVFSFVLVTTVVFFPLSFISCILFIRSKAAGLVTFKEERLHMSTNARGLGSLGTDGSLGHPLSSQSEGCLSATFCPSLTIPFSFGVSSIDSLTRSFWKSSWEKFFLLLSVSGYCPFS